MGEREVEQATQHPDVLGAGARKRESLDPQDKVHAVMKEYDKGTLHSGSGEKVTNPKQAVAIGLSEARKKLEKHTDPKAREKVYKERPYLRPKEKK